MMKSKDPKKFFSILKLILGLVLFVLVVPIIFYYCYLWGHRILEGGLLGGDIAYHMAWIETLGFYPKTYLWFPFAGVGSSIVLGYWVFSYYLTIIDSHLSQFSTDQWVRILEFVSGVKLITLSISTVLAVGLLIGSFYFFRDKQAYSKIHLK